MEQKDYIPAPPNLLKTVDDLFDSFWSLNPDSVAKYEVQYDKELGYPTYIYVDSDSTLSDEEISYTTEFINRIKI